MKRSLPKNKIQGYDTVKNDRSTGARGGVAFALKHGLVINKECRNTDFNIITNNEALVIDINLSNNKNLILATIYCPNGNPNLRLFETINNLSVSVMFVGDFNSKLEAFGSAKKNISGPMLKLCCLFSCPDGCAHQYLNKLNLDCYILIFLSIGHNHKQNSMAPEQIYPACLAFTKIH